MSPRPEGESMTVLEHLEAAEAELLAKAAEVRRTMDSLKGLGALGSPLYRVAVGRAKPVRLRPERARGQTSMASATLQILERVAPESRSTTELLKEAEGMGAVTEARNPPESLDLLLYKQKTKGAPIRKVATRTWVWDAAGVVEAEPVEAAPESE